MTPTTQVKLLRVLQERQFPPPRRPQRADRSTCACIAATNIDPLEAVQKGKLREDLFYRLNVFALPLPPLRERKEDLPLLVQAFINEFNARNQKSIAGVDHQAMRMLEQYTGRATCASCGTSSSGRRFWRPGRSSSRSTCRRCSPTSRRRSISRRWRSRPGTTVEEAERRLILMTLEHTRDNKTRAAEILGISLKTLHNKLNKLRLRPKKTGHSPATSRPRLCA